MKCKECDNFYMDLRQEGVVACCFLGEGLDVHEEKNCLFRRIERLLLEKEMERNVEDEEIDEEEEEY